MIRNLILLCVLILFWFGLHAQYHWVPVFKEKNVYMSDIHPEKNKKITDMETYHETVSSEKIFTEMIANNKQGIILALKDNNKKLKLIIYLYHYRTILKALLPKAKDQYLIMVHGLGIYN